MQPSVALAGQGGMVMVLGVMGPQVSWEGTVSVRLTMPEKVS